MGSSSIQVAVRSGGGGGSGIRAASAIRLMLSQAAIAYESENHCFAGWETFDCTALISADHAL